METHITETILWRPNILLLRLHYGDYHKTFI